MIALRLPWPLSLSIAGGCLLALSKDYIAGVGYDGNFWR